MVIDPPAIPPPDVTLCVNCGRPCRPDRKLCRACEARKTRGVPLSRPIRPYGASRWSRLVEAAIALADAEAEASRDAIRTAQARLRIAALRYAGKRR